MDIYIKWNNNKQSIQIPILPESFEIEGTNNNTTVTVHGLGDINLKGKRGLYSLSFESFFPKYELYCQRGSHHDPYTYYVKNLKALYENNTTVHVIVTETDINGYFTVESFDYGHDDKTKDVAYSLKFAEYRSVSATSSGTSKKGRTNKGAKTTTITWKRGDTWPKVTKRALGSSATSKKQRTNNKKVISKAKKKHPKKKEKEALIGYKVVIRP